MSTFSSGAVKPLPPLTPPSSRSDASPGADKPRDKPALFLQGLVEVVPAEVSFGRRSVCIATVRTVELVHAGQSAFSLPSVRILTATRIPCDVLLSYCLLTVTAGAGDEVVEHWVDVDNDGTLPLIS